MKRRIGKVGWDSTWLWTVMAVGLAIALYLLVKAALSGGFGGL